MAFSGGVKLGDLDDFIALSQECVKPLIEAAAGGDGAAKIGDVSDARSTIARAPEVELVKRPNLIKSKQSAEDPKAQIGQVSLSDCLACSGCVTSAETVLLQEQSCEEFLKRVNEAKLTVVSVSPEARSSLANRCSESPLVAMQKVTEGLRRLGVTYVLEGSASEAIALLEGKAEFVKRFKAKQSSSLPLLTSHCPGWTCYAEKVVDPAVLPHLLPLRPPQQIQGRFVKTCLREMHNRRRVHRWWRARSPLFAAETLRWSRSIAQADLQDCTCLEPGDVYHVYVQPCFDRKLEAARPGFTLDDGATREVDTVLTTTELLELLAGSVGIDAAVAQATPSEVLSALPSCPLNSEAFTDLFLGSLQTGRPQPLVCAVEKMGSGGFAEHIFRESARDLFNIDKVAPLEFKTKQNEDMKEVLLRDSSTQKVLLRFVCAYGFRNIQNVIRKLSKLDAQTPSAQQVAECGHFIEIMACPGGCLNGGGQLPAAKTAGEGKATGDEPAVRVEGQTQRRERLSRLEAVLSQGDGTAILPAREHPLVAPLYRYIAAAAAAAPGASAAPDAASGAGAGAGARALLAALPNGAQAAQADGDVEALVGSAVVQRWLAAGWRSLKVDEAGKSVVSSSALKW
eukprot:TRINITY_DN28789_c0_g1_i1.p1 TRINITY_DN28789_c0_g1~~TRINITY_DN28789_c0_g1_i1.p1  ORF type:complete len:626 (-),score=153.74 TRINITY_DN28789_c0_g1_i1:77-1954(-)